MCIGDKTQRWFSKSESTKNLKKEVGCNKNQHQKIMEINNIQKKL